MKKIGKILVLLILACFFYVSDVSAKVEVNSGSGSGNTSDKCNTGICANTITEYFGLSVKVCEYDSKNEKFHKCSTAKKVTNKNFTFSKPEICKTVADGSNYLNYCWSEYFKNLNETELKKLLAEAKLSYNDNSYLIIEPLVGVRLTITKAYDKYSASTTDFTGTASDVVKKMYEAGKYVSVSIDEENKNNITDIGKQFVLKREDGKVYNSETKKWYNPSISGEWNVLRNYFTSFKLGEEQGQYTIEYSKPGNKTAVDFANDISKSIYGKVIVKISDVIPTPEPKPDPELKCEIGKNNNTNQSYNWIKYNNTTQEMEPISNGCCSTYSKYGITKDEVIKNYPQCFIENFCKESTDSTGSQCTNSSKGSARSSLTLSLSDGSTALEELKYCYASKKYYSGIIDASKRIYYGCIYEDNLSLPQGFKNNLNQGSHFIWPTNRELLSVSPVDLDYEIIRTSTANCYAYQVQESTTGLSVPYNANNITNEVKEKIINSVAKKIDDNDIKVVQNEQEAGVLNIETIVDSGADYAPEFVVDDSTNGFFDVRIYSLYNQNLDSKSNSNSYRYYDNSSLSYLRYKDIKDTANIKYYKKYPYMLMPISNDFDSKKLYTYGLKYETDFAGLKMQHTYKCSLKVKNILDSCICPEGTDNAGLDLSNYSKTNTGGTGICSVSNSSECAVLQDEYCNNKDISYECPNIDYDLTNCINKKTTEDSNKSKVKAYNECVYENCACTSDDCDYKKICDPEQGGGDIIYRTIFLNNPFLEQNGSIRIPGSNWGGNLSISNNKYIGLAYKYINSTKDYMYDGDTMYSFTLTPEIIRTIKDYNKGKEYSDFTLECDDTDGRCYSKFLHNTLEETISGTCGSIKNKNKFQTNFYSCREESFDK